MGAYNHILILLSGEILTAIWIGAHFPLLFWGLTTTVRSGEQKTIGFSLNGLSRVWAEAHFHDLLASVFF